MVEVVYQFRAKFHHLLTIVGANINSLIKIGILTGFCSGGSNETG
jgi:hypothetical protein